MNEAEYQKRLKEIDFTKKHPRRFCPRCGSYGRVYGNHYCEFCKDDYDREQVDLFKRYGSPLQKNEEFERLRRGKWL